MPAALEVPEHHDAAEVSDVQGVGRGVDAEVCCGDFFCELFFGAGHDVLYHAAPFEFLYKVHIVLLISQCVGNIVFALYREYRTAGNRGCV